MVRTFLRWAHGQGLLPRDPSGHLVLGRPVQPSGRLLSPEEVERVLAQPDLTRPLHLEWAPTLNNLAAICYLDKRYEEAEPLCKRALEIDERELGPDHPDVATDMKNLAELYRAQERFGEAEPLYHKALEIRESSPGSVHRGRGPGRTGGPAGRGRPGLARPYDRIFPRELTGTLSRALEATASRRADRCPPGRDHGRTRVILPPVGEPRNPAEALRTVTPFASSNPMQIVRKRTLPCNLKKADIVCRPPGLARLGRARSRC